MLLNGFNHVALLTADTEQFVAFFRDVFEAEVIGAQEPMGGRLTFPGGGVYHATKYAVEALSDAMRFEVQGFGVKVVLIEPGLIITDFAKTAVASVDSGATEADGPYERFNRSVRKGTADVYAGPMAKLGGPPEVVAKVVHKALSSSRPRARYTVTPSAKLAIAQRAVTPDRLWDLSMRAQFPVPGKD